MSSGQQHQKRHGGGGRRCSLVRWLVFLLLAAVLALCAVQLPTALRLSLHEDMHDSSAKSALYPAGRPRFREDRFRIAYYISMATANDLIGLARLLRSIYHRDDLFIVHLDARADTETRAEVHKLMRATHASAGDARFAAAGASGGGNGTVQATAAGGGHPRSGGAGGGNMILLDNPMYVTWGGFTTLVSTMYGLAAAMAYPWEYWVNLSVNDMPLLAVEELRLVLKEFGRNETSFVVGEPYRAEETRGVDLRTHLVDDAGLYDELIGTGGAPALARVPLALAYEQRATPTLFTVYYGALWVLLHRSLADYIHHSPDNVARTLLAYFSKVPVSSNMFFPTVACHAKAPHFNVLNTNLRFEDWPDNTPAIPWQGPQQQGSINAAYNSGAPADTGDGGAAGGTSAVSTGTAASQEEGTRTPGAEVTDDDDASQLPAAQSWQHMFISAAAGAAPAGPVADTAGGAAAAGSGAGAAWALPAAQGRSPLQLAFEAAMGAPGASSKATLMAALAAPDEEEEPPFVPKTTTDVDDAAKEVEGWLVRRQLLLRASRRRRWKSLRVPLPIPRWLDVDAVQRAAEGGALFAHMIGNTGAGVDAGAWVEKYISDPSLSQMRLQRFWAAMARHTHSQPQLCPG